MKPMKHSKAFTLIELLVVISIIALLIGILLPALSQARATAQKIVCASSLKSIGTAAGIYAFDFKDHYSSPVNVGAKYLGRVIDRQNGGIVTGSEALEGTSDQLLPTSTQDWITPLLGDSLGFSDRRSKKVAQLSNDFSCASANVFTDALFPNGNGSGTPNDFEEINEEVITGIKQVSYLMPDGFAHFSQNSLGSVMSLLQSVAVDDGIPMNSAQLVRTSMLAHGNSPILPSGFRHKFTSVGTTQSNKIMAADGTRYWSDPGEGQVDGLTFNPESAPGRYGNYTSSSPTFRESTAYGRDFDSSSSQTNVDISMRHGDRNMNVLYFDGSVRTMDSKTLWTDPNPWHPTGTIWHDNDNTDESILFMEEQRGNRSVAKIN